MSGKRQVLIFYDYFSPAYKAGGPIQSISTMINALNYNFAFSVFCSNTDLNASELKVQQDKWITYQSAAVFYASRQFLKLHNIITLSKNKKPTVIFINGIYSWYFNIIPLLFVKGVRKVVSVRGMIHPGALSQKPFKKKVYLLLWKLLKIHHNCEFHATTLEEKQFIEKNFGKTVKIWVAGNFPKVLNYQPPIAKCEGSLILISIALISPMKNYLLVLQALKKCIYNIDYLIYGPVKEAGYWRECEQLIKEMPANIKVMYKGEIPPDEIPEALQEAHVFILPSKSENFSHAIYEAMTAGKPVITSHFTPWNNLKENNAGINVSIDNSQEIHSAIDFFAVADNATIEKWSKAARTFALESIDTNNINYQYLEMFSGNTNLFA